MLGQPLAPHAGYPTHDFQYILEIMQWLQSGNYVDAGKHKCADAEEVSPSVLLIKTTILCRNLKTYNCDLSERYFHEEYCIDVRWQD